MVAGVHPRADGSVWVATEGGFSRIKGGHDDHAQFKKWTAMRFRSRGDRG